MNASLATADRRTHLKIILATCCCCLGFVLMATHVPAPAGADGQSTLKRSRAAVQAEQTYRIADINR
jgi:hypothetical protein